MNNHRSNGTETSGAGGPVGSVRTIGGDYVVVMVVINEVKPLTEQGYEGGGGGVGWWHRILGANSSSALA